ncbi:HI0933-like family protein [Brucella rhizosphaerae]|uniref:HI0933-like family protein n=2 Tax=Brucella rhizosphaerae TaxID=571254 RepID=A0A256FNB4_9HYPH|nr:HI0933-like family protein [Brucella rhizosphaerae]
MSLSRERFEGEVLTGVAQTEVAVIGGGIAGLAASIELSRRGRKVTVLEAAKVGYGASGRANGQVISALTRHGPNALRNIWPAEQAERFIELVKGAADKLYALADRYQIDCDLSRTGWLQPAHSPGRFKRVSALAAQWAEAGAPATAIAPDALAARLGTNAYHGGWEHRGGGHINPYAFTVGLARGAASEGVTIFEQSPALNLTRTSTGWRIKTPTGDLHAEKVVLATAAHTGSLWPELRRSIVPVTSYQAATEPLGDLANTILPGNEASSDTRFDLRYFRKDREGRLVSGGALAIQAGAPYRLPAMVEVRLRELFPDLLSGTVKTFWGGRIAMTVDRLPHLHKRDDGLYSWIGCNGRGLALSCAMADVVADAVCGVADDQLALRPTPVPQVAFHPIVSRTARFILPYFRWQDGREV